jgi:hypothetical protein
LWTWTLLLAPGEAIARADVVAEAAGDTEARLLFPYENETWECKLRFDRASGLLEQLHTHRVDARSGSPLRWSVDVERYGDAAGSRLPARILMRWEG